MRYDPKDRLHREPLNRDEPATWSRPSTWIIGTMVALAIIFGFAFFARDDSRVTTAENPTTTNPAAGAQTSPRTTTGSAR
jgi:hypothetical protein